ncbi:MAG: hypothetical protein HYS13_22855 [Planctomycetia bacterium]|nr:hypothetical protein [Planctomycetia bacterium]
MTHAIEWLLQNTLSTAVLAAGVLVVSRFLKNRPALVHALWLVVLLKFVTPPVVEWPLPAWSLPPLAILSADNGAAPTGGDVVAAPSAAEPSTPAAGADAASDAVAERADPGAPVPDAPTPGIGVDPAVAEALRELAGRRRGADRHVLEGSLAREFAGLPPEAARGQAIPSPAPSGAAREAALSTRTPPAPLWTRGLLRGCLLAAWIVGALMVAVVQLRRILRHAALVRRAAAAPPHLITETRRLAGALGVRPPRAVVSPRIESPFVSCLVWLRLVWPETLSAKCDVERLRGVLAHELAHVRRRDHLVAWLELAAGLVWWWNPVFWLVRRKLREAAETACDALALSVLPDGRRGYAEAFLELSTIANRPAPLAALGASSGSRRSFERRLAMMLSERVTGRMSLKGLALVLVLAALALPSFSLGQTAPPRADGPPDPAGRSPAAAAPASPFDEGKSPAKADTTQLPRPTDDGGGLFDPNRAAAAAPADKGSDVARLEARIERLEKAIQGLADRLDRAGVMGEPTWPSGLYVPAKSDPAARHTITLSDKQCLLFRKNGQLVVEARDLQSGKPLWSTNLSIAQANITDDDSLTLSASTDRKLLVVSGKGDGTAVTVNIDAGSGRIAQVSLSSSSTGSGEVSGKGTDRKESTPRADSYDTGRPRGGARYKPEMGIAPRAGAGEEPSAGRAAGAEQIDLVNLATAYIDAVGNLSLAKSRCARLKDEGTNAIAQEVETAAIQLETAQKKLDVLTAIVSAAHNAAAEEMIYVQRMAAKGYASDSQVAAARAKLKIVESILKQGSGSGGGVGEDHGGGRGSSSAGGRRGSGGAGSRNAQ